jgi:hypothetical protein
MPAAAVSPEVEKADCDRRWAYLKDQGWKVTDEGIVLDTSDSRWHKSDRILIEYVEGLPFEEGVRAAYGIRTTEDARGREAGERAAPAEGEAMRTPHPARAGRRRGCLPNRLAPIIERSESWHGRPSSSAIFPARKSATTEMP